MELQAADHILPPFCCYSALALALRTIYRAPSARELALDLQAPASMGQAIHASQMSTAPHGQKQTYVGRSVRCAGKARLEQLGACAGDMSLWRRTDGFACEKPWEPAGTRGEPAQ